MSNPLSCKLLIVEDDTSIRQMLRSFFVHNGADVSTAKDGRSGIEMIRTMSFDVVILDVRLPFMDGLSITKKLREESNHTPIILLTEKNRIDDKVEGLEIGADDYVTKPFSTKELLARVNSLLRRIQSDDQNLFFDDVSIGSITISPLTREVHHEQNETIPLTKTEFDLLHFLGKRKQQVVHHGDLLKDVLGYRADSETKSLVMHIANIRRKLKIAGVADIQIKAVTGVGYMLVE